MNRSIYQVIAVVASLSLGVATLHAEQVAINLSGGPLKDASGNPAASGSLVLLVASTSDTEFANPTPSAFVSGDDIVIAAFGVNRDGGKFAVPVKYSYSGAFNATDKLKLFWFPTLTYSADANGNLTTPPPSAGVAFGSFDTATASGAAIAFTAPAIGGTYALNVGDAGNATGTVSSEAQPPTIDSFTATAAIGGNITITGTNLTGATVTIGGVAATVVSNNGTTMVVKIPDNAISGLISVTVGGNTVNSSSNFWVKVGRNDFNEDGYIDFIWYNPTTLETAVWILHSSMGLLDAFLGPQAPVGWNFQSVADYNTDGIPDFIWLNPNTTETAVWILTSTGQLVDAFLGPQAPSGWVIKNIADYNNDGTMDFIMWNESVKQSAVWLLTNNGSLIDAFLGPQAPAGWEFKSVADYDLDGIPDFILWNPTTLESAIWLLNADGSLKNAYLGPQAPAGWDLLTVADFNLDNVPDFILWNSSTHETAIWQLDGYAQLTSAFLGPQAPAGWSVQSVLDQNNDQVSDMILINGTTGETAVWLLDSSASLVSAFMGPAAPSGWQIQNPRLND